MLDNPHTILVVDPDERSYKTFESVLGSKNNVWFVPNGKTAIELPNSQNVDVIFVSHVLNGTDGIVLLESFKRRFPSIPVVFIAEQPKVHEVIAAFRSGARELIVKPIDAKELILVTQKILGFISNKKPNSRWFFSDKKKSQKNNSKKNYGGYLKKIFQKSKEKENLSVAELDALPVKETAGNTFDFSNHLIDDALIDQAQPAKVAHLITAAESARPLIEAFFFGSFRAVLNNQPIENWPGKKGKSIFAYLLLNHDKKIFRDVLMDIFWQKSSPDSARNCLNVAIHGIRKVLQDNDSTREYLLYKDECYYFNPEIEVWLDVEEFRLTWRKAQLIEGNENLSAAVTEYERAAEIYKGDFLEDELYDDWLSLDRENLKEVFLVILDKISKNFIYHNEHYKAIPVCENILEKDNCREDIHRRLMLSYYRIGQRDKAIKQFQKCVEVLKEELEVKPSSETTNLFEQLKRDSLLTKN